SLTEIEFGNKYNQPIVQGSLPASLTKIVFGRYFNQPIEVGCLPTSLTYLGIQSNFYNHDILPGTLPDSITHISMLHYIRSKIHEGALPQSLTSMYLSIILLVSIKDNVIPKSIRSLELVMCDTNLDWLESFPDVECMTFHGHAFTKDSMPDWDQESSIKTLRLEQRVIRLTAGMLPPTLTHLTLGDYFNQPLTSGLLPDSLIELHIGNSFDHPILGLPNSLTILTISDKFDQPLTSRLLPQLTKLKLGNSFRQLLPGSMKSLKCLAIGEAFIDKIIEDLGMKSNTTPQFKQPLELIWCSYVTLLRKPLRVIRSDALIDTQSSVCWKYPRTQSNWYCVKSPSRTQEYQ
ncbi:hypothetical protein SAMD00019534_015510, partial [Acytostelium subglobosum LB1]|uniref:hypothetical protein n=1 Tax=Acytostelium subglobosum LB1 TaxID=1410327 RepID=UPI000644AA1B